MRSHNSKDTQGLVASADNQRDRGFRQAAPSLNLPHQGSSTGIAITADLLDPMYLRREST